MNNVRAHIETGLLYTFAFAWPWDVLEKLPYAFIHLTSICAAGLGACLVLRLAARERLAVPFELLWPALALLAVAIFETFVLHTGAFWRAAGFAAAFVGAVQCCQSRGVLERALLLSTVSCVAVAALSIALYLDVVFGGPSGILIPTTLLQSVTGGVHFVGPRSSGWAFATLIIGVLFLLASPGDDRPSPGRKTVRSLAAVVLAAPLALALAHAAYGGTLGQSVARGLLAYPAPGPVGWAMILGPVLWLFARAAAKSSVLLAAVPWSARLAWVAVPLFCGAVVVATNTAPGPKLGLMLAFSVRRALPFKQEHTPSRAAVAWAGVLAPLLFFNHCQVSPSDGRDPRNYTHFARTYLLTHSPAAFRIPEVQDWLPGERRSYYWVARGALDAVRHPDALQRIRTSPPINVPTRPQLLSCAADAFAAMCEPCDGSALMPAPSAQETQGLLDELRDTISAVPEPERVLHYERALVAAGQADNALASLRFRSSVTESAGMLEAGPLSAALASLLGDPSITRELDQWPVAELLGIFSTLGARQEQAPALEPAPVVAAVWQHADAIELRVWTPEQIRALTRAQGAGMHRAGWVARVDAGGAWDLVCEADAEPAAHVRFEPELVLEIGPEAAAPEAGLYLLLLLP